MLKKELAEALGISAAMVSKLAKRGMPTDTVERAQRWRRRHLEPGRIKGVRYEPHRRPRVDPVEHANALGAAALDDFDGHALALRAALRAVPWERTGEVSLPVEVWEDLYGPEALELLAETSDPVEDSLMTPEQDEHAERIWWGLATGQWAVAPDPNA